MTRSLAVLDRLRRIELDSARRGVAVADASAADATARLSRSLGLLRRNAAMADAPQRCMESGGSFGAWIQAELTTLGAVEAKDALCTANADQARLCLREAVANLGALEKLAADRRAAVQARSKQAEQRDLDEAGQRSRAQRPFARR